MSNFAVPQEIRRIVGALEEGGFEAFVVGGCVRDMLRGAKPKDWDIATNARPEQIQERFANTFYENEYGTVGVVLETDDETLKVVEVTPYRIEGKYSDARRPDEVTFSDNLEDDLKRRDFTINAIAYNPSAERLVDPFGGQDDLAAELVRAVGEPRERFGEDALRLLRAVRIAAELSFTIEAETERAIAEFAPKLKHISAERVRDELTRILCSAEPAAGLRLTKKLDLLPYVVPELLEGVDIEQNQAHSFTVFEHTLRVVQHAADKDYPLAIRLAALFHDIAKPATRRWSGEKGDWTFYGHEVVGARMAKKRLGELKYPRETVEKVAKLVRWHMFFSDPEEVTLSAVRRMVRNVGEENIWDLMHLRICDRIGTGRPKEQPFRFRKYQSMIEEALRSPVSVGQLNIDGARLMELCDEPPGPRIGWMLHALLEEVLDDPLKNTEEHLERRARELSKLPARELEELGEAGKRRREEEDEAAVRELREKYHVK